MWEEAISLVRRRLGNTLEFNTWFRPIQPRIVDKDEVVVVVPDRFFSDWLSESGYVPLLEESLASVAGRPLRLRVEYDALIAPTRAPVPPPEPPPTPVAEPEPSPSGTRELLPDYVFDTYVVGPSNQFAHAACQAVAEHPATNYNPLFIYGGVGLGKTHLLHAIGNEIQRKDPSSRVKYVSSESYINDLIESIRLDRMQDFRERYRTQCDVLLVDDIQFIAGKDRTQEEFFHTFNALYGSNKQIVFSSDRFPQEIPGLEERLRSRFQWGLIADIKPPQIETRVAILRKKAARSGVSVPDDVSMFIASRVRSNVRQLEGALTKLAAFASLNVVPITLAMAKDVLKDFLPDDDRQVSVDDIIRLVGQYFNVKPVDIKGTRRHKAISLPRQVAMFLARRHTNLSFPEIGARFGDRDHTTIMSGVRKIEKLLPEDGQLQKAVEILERQLNVSN